MISSRLWIINGFTTVVGLLLLFIFSSVLICLTTTTEYDTDIEATAITGIAVNDSRSGSSEGNYILDGGIDTITGEHIYDSIWVKNGATLKIFDAKITVNGQFNVTGNDPDTGSVIIIENSEIEVNIGVAEGNFTADCKKFELMDSVLEVYSRYGGVDGDTENPDGEVGGSTLISIKVTGSETLKIIGSILYCSANDGGRGLDSTTGDGGRGGDGGSASISIQSLAVGDIEIISSTLECIGGDGGKGGRRAIGIAGTLGGDGGDGGSASIQLLATHGDILIEDSKIICKGGDGGDPGHLDDLYGGNGGSGGDVEDTELVAYAEIEFINSTFEMLGGLGGAKGTEAGETGSSKLKFQSAVLTGLDSELDCEYIEIDLGTSIHTGKLTNVSLTQGVEPVIIGDTRVELYWYLEIHVYDNIGNPLDEASVEITDSITGDIFTGLTDTYGYIKFVLLGKALHTATTGTTHNYLVRVVSKYGEYKTHVSLITNKVLKIVITVLTVEIIYPKPNQVVGGDSSQIYGNALSPDPENRPVVEVRVTIDPFLDGGESVKAELVGKVDERTWRWEATWDTTRYPDGIHMIEVTAKDKFGLQVSASVNVTVDQNSINHEPRIRSTKLYFPLDKLQKVPYSLRTTDKNYKIKLTGEAYDLDKNYDPYNPEWKIVRSVNISIRDLTQNTLIMNVPQDEIKFDAEAEGEIVNWEYVCDLRMMKPGTTTLLFPNGKYEFIIWAWDGELESSTKETVEIEVYHVMKPRAVISKINEETYTEGETVIVESTQPEIEIKFSAEGSEPYYTGHRLDYRWEFGDGEVGNGVEVTHRYKLQKGENLFTVKLIVVDINEPERPSSSSKIATLKLIYEPLPPPPGGPLAELTGRRIPIGGWLFYLLLAVAIVINVVGAIVIYLVNRREFSRSTQKLETLKLKLAEKRREAEEAAKISAYVAEELSRRPTAPSTPPPPSPYEYGIYQPIEQPVYEAQPSYYPYSADIPHYTPSVEYEKTSYYIPSQQQEASPPVYTYEQQKEKPLQPPSPPPQQQPTAIITVCPNCRTQVQPDWWICPNCRQSLK